MSKEITSLNAIEYFEGQQCLAFFNIPQNLEEEDQDFQGALSYQKTIFLFPFFWKVWRQLMKLLAHQYDQNTRYSTL